MTSQEILYKGAEIKTQISQLEEEYEMMKPLIDTAVREVATDEKLAVNVGDLGQFQLGTFRLWKYSTLVTKKEKELKQLKTEEKANGDATCEETPIVKFITKKEEKNETL